MRGFSVVGEWRDRSTGDWLRPMCLGAIDHALVSPAKIVLADELTAASDKQSGRDMVDLMQKLAKEQGCTTLMVTHDNRVLDVADHLIYMRESL